MPFGTFSAAYRLGIANSTQRNPTAFAQTVLRLPASAPVYQQQLVHDMTNRMGPPASAEWCGNPDAEIGRSNILRQVSAHDFVFGKRNGSCSKP